MAHLEQKLTLNIAKSKFMVISNKKSISKELRISINDSTLEQCDRYKYLGVMIDKNLTWKSHIEYISTKISRACGALAKLRHCVDCNVLTEVYHALIHSYVRYGIIAWGAASESVLKPLQTLMNRALRIMSFAPFGRVDLEPIYQDLNILNVRQTFILESSKFMFKLKKGLLPTEIANYFSQSQPVARTNSYNLRTRRQTPLLIIPRLASSEKSICIRGEILWNSISEEHKSSDTYLTFKRNKKAALLSEV